MLWRPAMDGPQDDAEVMNWWNCCCRKSKMTLKMPKTKALKSKEDLKDHISGDYWLETIVLLKYIVNNSGPRKDPCGTSSMINNVFRKLIWGQISLFTILSLSFVGCWHILTVILLNITVITENIKTSMSDFYIINHNNLISTSLIITTGWCLIWKLMEIWDCQYNSD